MGKLLEIARLAAQEIARDATNAASTKGRRDPDPLWGEACYCGSIEWCRPDPPTLTCTKCGRVVVSFFWLTGKRAPLPPPGKQTSASSELAQLGTSRTG
jgi:hypothetical protein